jgi:hypothetical protein
MAALHIKFLATMEKPLSGNYSFTENVLLLK